MARIAKPTQPAAKTGARRSAAAASPRSAAALPARKPSAKESTKESPKESKDELRARVEKLERANSALRAKAREVSRAAADVSARMAELEEQVTRLETRLASPAAAAPPAPARTSGGTKRQRRPIDPGDAVPPGVAVEQPAPLDQEAANALRNLEHLGE